jgi:hypothetical protein
MSIIINMFFFAIVAYLFFYFVFFYFFSVVVVDTLIGISILFLFFLIYFFLNKSILSFFLLRSKTIFVFFFKILLVVINIRHMVLSLNKTLIMFLNFEFVGLSAAGFNFTDYKVFLLKLFFYNNINVMLNIKLQLADKLVKFLFSIDKVYLLEHNLNNISNNFFLFLLNNN